MASFENIKIRNILKILFVTLLFLTLWGCQGFGDAIVKTAQVIFDPSIQVGDNAEQPSKVTLSIHAEKDVNKNPYSEGGSAQKGTPLAFKVIQLKDDSLFKGADFEMLETKLEETLKTTYLKHDDYEIEPGVFKFIDAEEIEDKTKFLAIVASYRDITKTTTTAIAKLEPNGQKYHIFIEFNAEGCRLKVEE